MSELPRASTFPFLQVAKMRGLPYGVVLRVADHIEGRGKLTHADYAYLGVPDWEWIRNAVLAEAARREWVQQ